jgi:hypothetical protein
MNARSTILFFGLLLGAGFARASEPAGIYVKKESHYYRIEFLADGKCYFSYPRLGRGTWTKEKDTLVCARGDEAEIRFRLKGKVLVDQDGNEWAAREDVVKMPWGDVFPVTMVVLDRETRKPITRFSYSYTMSTPAAEYDPLLVRPTEVQSADGTFRLMAPKSCKIETHIGGETLVGGYGSWRTYNLTTDNKFRRIEALVETGVTVQGVVVDLRTGKPIEGALVSPIVFTPPLFTPDRDRGVKTDAQGKFMIRGVDRDEGIGVWHFDYLESRWSGSNKDDKKSGKIGDKLYAVRVSLESGEKLLGIVKDPSGKPLAEVEVSDGAGKDVRTRQDGSFALPSPRKWGNNETYNLSFNKEGYLGQELHPKSADPKGFSVVLQSQPVLTGQVLAPDGQSLKKYDVSAGVGFEPGSWACASEKINNPAGRFSLRVRTDWDFRKEGKVWIGVRAPEFAPWETTVDVWEGAKSVVARLAPGVAVHGAIDASKARQGTIYATLLPCRIHKEQYSDETSQRQEFGRRRTPVGEDGTFRFQHVGPGQYLLAIAGPAIAPISTGVLVADADLDAGRFSPQGTGSIEGLIYKDQVICTDGICRLDEKRGLWAFAEGEISFQDAAGRSNAHESPHLRPIPFKADEKGRFRVDGIPAGMVSVNIPYHATADIINAHSRTAMVLEGKTTEVRFFDTSGRWDVVCRFVVGDGSPAQFAAGTGMIAKRRVDRVTGTPPDFEVRLRPKEDAPLSFGNANRGELDKKNQVPVRDIHPGRYRLLISDWRVTGWFGGVCYEGDADVKDGGTTLSIPLGAGSITGAVEWSKKYRYMIHVIAVGRKPHTIRHSRCDDHNNFCVCYLPEDEYTLWAHDYDAGWCKMSEASVKNNIVDIGSHRLATGGAITGRMPPRLETDMTVVVEATDANAVTIENPNRFEPVGKSFAISGLWPGEWTVRMKRGDKVIAEKAVVLQGTETVACDLAENVTGKEVTGK